MPAEQPSLLVCGSLTANPDETHLSRLRSALLHDAQLAELRDAVKELGHLWNLLVEKDPRFHRVGALPLLEILADWLTNGNNNNYSAGPVPFSLQTAGNAILAVLTVLSHLLEYITYLNNRHGTELDAHANNLEAVRQGGIQGLCVGLLSAIALACSRDKSDISRHGAVAVRLALCVGAYVDLEEVTALEPSVCFSARWPRGEENGDDSFDAVLDSYPQAYTSVRMDACSVTITAPRGTAVSLMDRLQKDGAAVKQMELRGRFHHKGHWPVFRQLADLCASTPILCFPPPSRLLVPVRRNDEAGMAQSYKGPLHEMALQCILVEEADWSATLKKTVMAMAGNGRDALALILGPLESVPRSVLTASAVRTVRATVAAAGEEEAAYYPDHSMAVIGASCRFPLSETLDDFWETIQNKRSGNSLETSSSFDCGLFGKSAREAEYLDPQHRLGLHLAYEALESAGLLAPTTKATRDDVGCYVGMSSSDYADNVNGRPATAFSYTGTARAFASGQISHFFGLTGPSMVVDTACSSSAVAIHTACAAIQAGECTMALAGGINLMTVDGRAHRNLAAASFLSPSGRCRPFDATADGYCRGEGGGFVLLKRLSAAVADNDRILGVLAGSAINQGKGSRSITLPSSESQSQLYHRVLRLSGMRPQHVSYIEAHGTGTQKGDPVEMQSIRRVFGRALSGPPLRLGSVKANIGHAEAASGIAALVKVLLMLRHATVPPQAGFSVLNPIIPPLETAKLEILTRSVPWNDSFRTALVSNYGASGANVAMLVCQPPPSPSSSPARAESPVRPSRHPVLITAHSAASLKRYCHSLLTLIAAQRNSLGDGLVPSIAFGLAQRQNQRLPFRALFSVRSTNELESQLRSQAEAQVETRADTKPVVLLFAGQTGRSWRLSQTAYASSSLLRHHLDRCDRTLQMLGLDSLFPLIFDSGSVDDDIVHRHCMLFSLQYSVAASWIDAGLEIAAVVGHSLGQLTALCVSGVLGLRDGLRLVSGRASLIRDRWGSERGCMLRVDADAATVEAIIQRSKPSKVEVACYNAAAHHVVVGTKAALTVFEEAARSVGVSVKKMTVSHGFHSEMVDCIVPQYQRLIQGLVLHQPSIPLEACTESGQDWADISAELIARQSREPVYFAHAVSRLEKRLGSCIWVEAGSGSVGTTMTRRALDSRPDHTFHSIQLDDDLEPMASLADTTLGLWRQGVRVRFWQHQASQRSDFAPLELPPYQFDMSQHWLPAIDQKEEEQETRQRPMLVSRLTQTQGHEETVEFAINQQSDEYATFVRGRTVFGHVLAPASVYIESAARAFSLLPAHCLSSESSVEVADVQLHAPFGLDLEKQLRLTLRRHKGSSWHFAVKSSPIGLESYKLLASGTIRWQGNDNAYLDPHRPLLLRLGDRCQHLREDRSASVVQGAFVKRMMGRMTVYHDDYFGIQSITSKSLEAVGCVSMPVMASRCSAETIFSPPILDNFLLVAELHASSLAELGNDHIYVCSGFDVVVPQSSSAESAPDSQGPWTVLSSLDNESDRKVVCDIFVFSAPHNSLFLAIMGVRFNKVSIRSFRKEIKAVNGTGQVDESVTSETSERHRFLPVGSSVEAINTMLGPLDVEAELSDANLSHRRRASLTSLVTSTDDSTDSLGTPSKQSLLQVGGPDFAGEKQAVALLNLLKEHLNSSQGIPLSTPLSAIGLDSLGAIQLQSDMEKMFGKRRALTKIDENATFSDLYGMLCCREADGLPRVSPNATKVKLQGQNERPFFAGLRSLHISSESDDLVNYVGLALDRVHQKISTRAQKTGFAGFFSGGVYQKQMSLVQAYILEAFSNLGCDLKSLQEGDDLPHVQYAPKYERLMSRFCNVLQDMGLIVAAPDRGTLGCRTSMPLPTFGSSAELHDSLLIDYPRYRPDHRLLDVTGSKLADCLSGRADPLQLIFRDEASIQLLEDVYVSSPMFATGNEILGDFIDHLISDGQRHGDTDRLRILEIGAGTGATTQLVMDRLLEHDISFTYTFTDVSVALTASARKRFKSRYSRHKPRCNIEFTALDIEKPPPASMVQSYDVIISSNCIHATKDLQQSCLNMEELLRRDGGVLCLLELTRPLAWLDCVFGLLDGWWRFQDDRAYALADEHQWEKKLLNAGFRHVGWSDDGSPESQQFRLIVACR